MSTQSWRNGRLLSRWMLVVLTGMVALLFVDQATPADTRSLPVRDGVVIASKTQPAAVVIRTSDQHVYVVRSAKKFQIGSRVRIEGTVENHRRSVVELSDGTVQSRLVRRGRTGSYMLAGWVIGRNGRHVVVSAGTGTTVVLTLARGVKPATVGGFGSRRAFSVRVNSRGQAVVTRVRRLGASTPNRAIPVSGKLVSAAGGIWLLVGDRTASVRVRARFGRNVSGAGLGGSGAPVTAWIRPGGRVATRVARGRTVGVPPGAGGTGTTTTPPATSPTTPATPGGAAPSAATTGTPTGVVLAPYTGSCRITAAGTVIDARTITCDMVIAAPNVKITRSRVVGTITVSDSGGLTISDTSIEAGNKVGTGLDGVNFTATRLHVTGGNRSINCFRNCTVEYSYVHGQMTDSTGQTHESGIRVGSYSTIRFNTIVCDAPNVPPDAGCSASLTGYGDFAVVEHVRVEGNTFPPSTGGYCAYGGSSPGKPYSSGTNNIVFINNVFVRGKRACGYYGPITSFDSSRPGNVWSGNKWDDGSLVPPAN